MFPRFRFIPVLGPFCVGLERGYAHLAAALWRVDPRPLFDGRYYLSRYPDVAASGMDPFYHFVRFGAAERRFPHPLFDTGYYLERYPDVARARHNPLFHFLRYGGMEGRSPHPDFDSFFYLATNPDVAKARINPLVHFIRYGAAEARSPHPEFDFAFYLASHPDIAVTQINPLLHFVEHGAEEGRTLRPSARLNLPPECFLPVTGYPRRLAPSREIDVVIPVYKGVAETQACLESALSSACAAKFRIVVVNDCSPEPALTAYVRRLAGEGRIVLIENARNLGFVESVNAGMRSSDRDVVLLNSDTRVFGDWLDRLSACAYAEERTATVTPFSNNATICSYPAFCVDNRLSPSIDMAALDSVFASVNRGRSVQIPTAIGFCMYIRRDCLNEAGLFDAEAFGKGYGEENDFCMRTAAQGWKHKLACDVFVYHSGSVSFGGAAPARQEAAMRTIIARYPDYPDLIRRHVQADPAKAFRIAVTAQRIQNSARRVFVSVIHALGGGVAEHVRQLAELTGGAIWLTLRPLAPRSVVLECAAEGFQFSLSLDPKHEHETLETIFRACHVERIHIHHLIEHSPDLWRALQNTGIPFDFTIHDYYTLCPQVTLSDEHGHYCGEPDEAGCNDCLEKRRPHNGLVDISSWRAAHSWLLLGADRVIAPSVDAAARIARYYPEARIVAAEHPGANFCGVIAPRPLSQPDQPLRVAVLGTQTIHKGFELMAECAEAAARRNWPIQFTLIGHVETGIRRRSTSFTETGRYEQADLPSILDRVAPHIVWFPGRVPETFSYTLSTCLESGLPVAAHDVGAFPERLGNRPWSWVLPRDMSAADWAEFFLRIRRDHFLTARAPHAPEPHERARADFYPRGYLATDAPAPASRSSASRRSSGRIEVAAAVASDPMGQIQACGYVRVVQPLTHPALADTVRLAIRSPRDLAASDADVILVQRVAVQDMELAERIVERCRRRGARLVFETDDDLFHIPEDHPESQHYLRIAKAAEWLAKMADAVLTSTDALREQLLPLNANTIVSPNLLDERLWPLRSQSETFNPDEIRVLYAGTVSHRDDLEFLGRAVRKLSRHRRERVRIDVVGVTSQAAGWFQAVPVPGHIAPSYPRFVQWLQGKNHWHWGVAPLLDTPFNRSKSALKFLEYSALGLASISSDVAVYRQAIEAGRTGILVPNDPDSWRDALEASLGDEALWRRLRANSQSVVTGNTIGARAQELKAVWASLAPEAAQIN